MEFSELKLDDSVFWSAALLICVAIGLLLGVGVVWVWNWRKQRSGRRNPLTQHLLRSPGQSIRDKIEDVRWDVAAFFGLAMLPAPLAIAFYLADWVARGQQPSMRLTVMLGLMMIAAQGFLMRKLWKWLNELQRLRLGYEAELAVGQELNDLGRIGYRAYHDLPVDERAFNIDHVLVGPAGVFAVETKGRPKPETGNAGRDAWEVHYDGDTLQFPGWHERKPLRQAVAASDWLRDWLTSSVGDRVVVQPLLVLPGWYVKRTAGKGFPVLSGRQIGSYFSKLRRDARMSDEMIKRIAHQLDQRCRDVEPRAYAKDKK